MTQHVHHIISNIENAFKLMIISSESFDFQIQYRLLKLKQEKNMKIKVHKLVAMNFFSKREKNMNK
jgi:hypothetical protein